MGCCLLKACRDTPGLFADAEIAEDPAQQIVAAELAGDLAEDVLCQAQFLGQQFAGVRGLELLPAGVDVCERAFQRIEVAAAGGEGSRCGPRSRRPP